MLLDRAPSWRQRRWPQPVDQSQDLSEQRSWDGDVGHLKRDVVAVAHDLGADLDQLLSQGGPARSIRHVLACRDRDSTAVVRGDPATDRRPAAEASTDMTSNVSAAGLNRRAPGARHLPNGRLLAPDFALTWSRMHRVAHPRPPNRDQWPRFRSMLDRATVFVGWWEPYGKSRVRSEASKVKKAAPVFSGSPIRLSYRRTWADGPSIWEMCD